MRSDIDTITTQSATAVAFAESYYDAAMRTDKWGPCSGHDKSKNVRERSGQTRQEKTSAEAIGFWNAYETTHRRPERELSLLNIGFLLNRSIGL